MITKDFAFYEEVYNTVENFKTQNKDNYSPIILRNLSYQEVINKYSAEAPSLLTRGNKYVGEWLTAYKRRAGIINTNENRFMTDNKLITYGIILSVLKLKNPFRYNHNYVCTLPGIENSFKFEKLLLRKLKNITEISCVEAKPKSHKHLSQQELPGKVRLHSTPIMLEEYLNNYCSENRFSFIWADFCSISKIKGFEDIVYKVMKPFGIFAITESQRQCGEMLEYRFKPSEEHFEMVFEYTYQPANMILKIYQIKKLIQL